LIILLQALNTMKRELFKKILFSAVLPLFFGLAGAWIFGRMSRVNSGNVAVIPPMSNTLRAVSMDALPDGFVKASAISTPAVVFIKTQSTVQMSSPFGWFWDFDPFGSRGEATSTGSGVIVSKDGYIVTNNHVIANANKITVVLNQRKQEYTAKVVGTDPGSDLALIKIDASDLPAIVMANSDNIQVGDWVLAVGNPFNLTSTVTAGIVSAKGRNINLMQNQFPIESFIQTDAAINPGNSGGALVNLAGELVGINTAIQSNTGSYTGYGFAIPSNIVHKIVKDLVDFGEVQRAFPGMEVADLTAARSKALNFLGEGVEVTDLIEDGPALGSGMKKGDIVTSVNGRSINSKAQYDEYMAYMRPGETAKFKVWRSDGEVEVEMKLINKEQNKALLMKGAVNSKIMGCDFQPLNATDLKKYGITSGIRLLNIKRGTYFNQLGLADGFIIITFNGKSYTEAEELISAMESATGRIRIEGMDKNGNRGTYSYYTN
jgi:Do/DeqQ family serine protease